MKGLSFAVLKVTLGVTSLWPCLILAYRGAEIGRLFLGWKGLVPGV